MVNILSNDIPNVSDSRMPSIIYFSSQRRIASVLICCLRMNKKCHICVGIVADENISTTFFCLSECFLFEDIELWH